MDQAGERRVRPVRRALRPAGHRLVSPLERLRRRARQFRRRDRLLRQSQAEGARRSGRSGAAGRQPDVGGGGAGLYAVRHSRAAPAARPRPCRRKRDRPQLSSRARHRRDLARILRRARRRRAAGDDPLVGRNAGGAGRLSRLERAGAGQSGQGAIERDHVRDPATLARRHLHQRRRQFLDLGRPLPALSQGRAAIGPDVGLDGLRLAGGDRRQARVPEADGRLLRRRRRLSHERAGIRDRSSIRPGRGRRA